MNAYETINDILVHLFNEIWELEEKAIITEEYKDISNNDMHIIEAIGLGKGNNMSAIAKKLNITVGSLTTSMNSLVNKKYAVRIRSEEDRRVVYFHTQMTQAVVDKLTEEEIPVLLKTLNGLSEFFRNYHERE